MLWLALVAIFFDYGLVAALCIAYVIITGKS